MSYGLGFVPQLCIFTMPQACVVSIRFDNPPRLLFTISVSLILTYLFSLLFFLGMVFFWYFHTRTWLLMLFCRTFKTFLNLICIKYSYTRIVRVPSSSTFLPFSLLIVSFQLCLFFIELLSPSYFSWVICFDEGKLYILSLGWWFFLDLFRYMCLLNWIWRV